MVDARGLNCPMPVLMVQKALKAAPAQLEVLVDNPAAKENVSRFAASCGYAVKLEEADECFKLTLTK